MGLAVAYARLGEEKAAMREFATATTDMRRSHADFDEGVALALIQLALGQKAAAIDSLGQYMALQTKDGRSLWWVSPAHLRIDPTWDPIRDDPRFQALLAQYADAAPVASSPASSTRECARENHAPVKDRKSTRR